MNNNKQNTIESMNQPVKIEMPINAGEAVEFIQGIGFLMSISDEKLIEKYSNYDTTPQLYHIGKLLYRLSEGLLFGLDEITERFIALNRFYESNESKSEGENLSINLPMTATAKKVDSILQQFGVDAPMPPLEQINQINLQITIENGGQNNGE